MIITEIKFMLIFIIGALCSYNSVQDVVGVIVPATNITCGDQEYVLYNPSLNITDANLYCISISLKLADWNGANKTCPNQHLDLESYWINGSCVVLNVSNSTNATCGKHYPFICQKDVSSVTPRSSVTGMHSGRTMCSQTLEGCFRPVTEPEWIKVGMIEYLVSKTETVFTGADENCQTKSNATLVSFASARMYLTVAASLNLTQGSYWVKDASRLSSTECLYIHVSNTHEVVLKLSQCSAWMFSICCRVYDQNTILTDPFFLEIMDSLSLDKRKTSRFQRKLRSSNDDRMSSKAIGGIGTCIILSFVVTVVLCDMPKVVHWCNKRKKKRALGSGCAKEKSGNKRHGRHKKNTVSVIQI